MKVLGLNGVYTHDSSAAIVVDGSVVAAVEEERFTHKKHTSDFPENSVNFCLEEAEVSEDEIDIIVIPFQVEDRLQRSLEFTANGLVERKRLSICKNMSEEHQIDGLIRALEIEQRFLRSAKKFFQFAGRRFPRAALQFYPHHLCHAASTYLVSGFRGESMIFVADLVGEWDATSVFLGCEEGITKKYSLSYPVSYGKIYNLFTEFLGFRSHSDEYKVMGLAAYGDDKYRDFFDTIFVGDGSRQEPGEGFAAFTYHVGLKPGWTSELNTVFGASRSPHDQLEKRHANIAKSLQCWLERQVVKHVSSTIRDSGINSVCLAGGVCLNAVMNQKIRELEGVESLFVQPASHDAGTAIGAALQAHRSHEPSTEVQPLLTYYLGPDCHPEWPAAASNSVYKKVSDKPNPNLVAELLFDGKILAVCRGRSEFGPRALGNRSILAMASDPFVRDRINDEIKKREDFRPFAPVILEQFAGDYFVDCECSPHMTMTFTATEKALNDIPSAVHVDGTARVQTVNAAQNAFLFDVLTEFYKISGVPALLNTSLNIAGDTMALTIDDAWGTFVEGNIDAIVIDAGIVCR